MTSFLTNFLRSVFGCLPFYMPREFQCYDNFVKCATRPRACAFVSDWLVQLHGFSNFTHFSEVNKQMRVDYLGIAFFKTSHAFFHFFK